MKRLATTLPERIGQVRELDNRFDAYVRNHGLSREDLTRQHLARGISAWAASLFCSAFALNALLATLAGHVWAALGCIGVFAALLALAFSHSYRCYQIRQRSLDLSPSDWLHAPREWLPDLRWKS